MGHPKAPRFWTRVIVASVLVLLAVCGAARADGSIADLPVERYQLANGLKVALAPDPSLEEVGVIVHYDVGSADDPSGKEGLAHLVEHLMFDGSRHVAPGEFYQQLVRAGGVGANGTTSLDSTNYSVTLPQESLPLLFWLESDRMGFVSDRLNQRMFDNERRIIADERRDRILDQNLGFVHPIAWMSLFPAWHPYRRSQTDFDLAYCSLDDVRAFLRTWYSPSNATIAVAGRFDAPTVRSLIDRYFGDLPGAPPPQRPALPSHWRLHDVSVEAAADVPSDSVTFQWVAPALDQPGDAALDLAATILADPDGRLQRDLVAKGLAVNVGARERSSQRMSVFSINVTVAEGVPVDRVVGELDHAIGDLGTFVRPEEYQRAHDEWFDSLMLRLETPLGRAQRLVLSGASRRPWDLDKYDGIRPADVAAAVRSILIPDNRVVLVVHHDRAYRHQGVILSRKARLP
jgi:predicted Zn-dependent peptidase